MLEINKNPLRKELRLFACVWFPLAGIIVGVLFRMRSDAHLALCVWAISAIMFIVGVLAPRLVKPVFLGMSYFTYPLGFCLSYIVLALMFGLVMFPTSILMRLFRFDPLCRNFDQRTSSYWYPRKEESDFKQHFRQF